MSIGSLVKELSLLEADDSILIAHSKLFPTEKQTKSIAGNSIFKGKQLPSYRRA